mmetsp:Transcript_24989/g.81891  ORF Transcript_24989/g.81891 Transcript_24989/m.81891 type:complete len:143 (+) Transcript_24989:1813-2241(+)
MHCSAGRAASVRGPRAAAAGRRSKSSFVPGSAALARRGGARRTGRAAAPARVASPGPSRSVATMGLFGLGVPELVVIGAVAAVLFGPSKLPEVGRSLGKTVKSFQEAAKEFETELKDGKEKDAAAAAAAPPEVEGEEEKKSN